MSNIGNVTDEDCCCEKVNATNESVTPAAMIFCFLHNFRPKGNILFYLETKFCIRSDKHFTNPVLEEESQSELKEKPELVDVVL